ncbi:MAG: MFS transporter [Flavobacteriales bacterium]|nr:MFS transporter [Flavobacteriales bacterium]NCA20658.1 MFS transporter [Crocinitomicaceae bacterium]
MIQKGDKKIIRGWVMYDWANSVYNLVISSAIFPIFYDTQSKIVYAENNNIADWKKIPEGTKVTIDFFGQQLSNSVIYSFVLSASFLVVALLSPILSGIADYTGSKKRFLQFFCYFGSFAAMSLYFFDAHYAEIGMLSIFIASIGFWNSLVFYNAFLPEIAEPIDQDKISARGFSMGYLGSMILLVFCLIWIQVLHYEVKWCFVFVGVWWIGFSQFTYRVLPINVHGKKPEPGYIWRGFRELKLVFKEFKRTKRLKRYLYAFFFFNTGVQTVMLMATIFANKEIQWPEGADTSGLIIAILLIQILGALGAFLMSRLSNKIGNIYTLMFSVALWIGLCVFAFFIKTPNEFYTMAAGVGLVMGGVQAIARSTYSKFLPPTTDSASYFSFYDVTEKIGIVFGTFFFGFMEYITNSLRMSVMSVTAFFVIGFILLFFVPKKEIELETTH